MPYIGRGITTGDFTVITLTESFDGSRVAFTMSESVGNVNQLLVILSGVLQHWTDAFTISGTTLTFSSAPASGETIKILKLGDVVNIGVPSDASVTAAKVASTIDLSSKTITLPAANTYNDDKVQSNIALLGFKTAVNGSLAKYNLQDQIIDEYEDATGIDASASTNETLVSGTYFGGSAPTITQDADATGVDGLYTWYKWTDTGATGSYSINSTQAHDYLVIAGGGGGGNSRGGGGGAGGYLTATGLSLVGGTTYTMTIGTGGAGGTSSSTKGTTGVASSIAGSDITDVITVGGGGGGSDDETGLVGGSGGAGGGGGAYAGAAGTAGQGTAGATSVSGFSGNAGGGGGGAGGAGTAGNPLAGAGGAGLSNSYDGSATVRASGGGGGSGSGTNTGAATAGGGGRGGWTGSGAAGSGTANTGGGGGGAGDGDGGAGGSGIIIIRRLTSAGSTTLDLTLQSTDTTASTEADNADMVMLMENAAGTATLNTDIKGWISRDSGANFTQGTLVDEGTWGTNKKILAFHDLDISSQPSGTSMCYKITTHNQSASSKETKIHATSIGWK